VSARSGYPGPAATPPAPPVAGTQVEGTATVTPLGACFMNQFPQGAMPNDFPGALFSAAAFRNMYDWVRAGAAPPKAERIETTPEETTALDELGNAMGGVRSPYVDVPITTYAVGADECFLYGYKIPLSDEQRQVRHGSHADYVAEVEARARALAAERLILDSGADEILREAQATSW
jgi:hypothetical protein